MDPEQKARLQRQHRWSELGSELLGLGMTIVATGAIVTLILGAVNGLH